MSQELAKLVNQNLQKTAELVRSFKQVAVDHTSEKRRVFNLKEYIEEILLSMHAIIQNTNTIIKNPQRNFVFHERNYD